MHLRFAWLAAFALVTALPAAAAAQTVQIIQSTSLPRLDANGSDVPKRSLTARPEGVSHQDCVDAQKIAFPLQLTGFEANATLEAWASLSGVDCGSQTHRTGANASCWQLLGGIPLEPTPRVNVPVRNILSGASSAATPDAADPHLCDAVDLSFFSVQFLYFGPGQTALPSASATVELAVDTVGPAPPDGVGVLAGNHRVQLIWNPRADVIGQSVYCAPNTVLAAGGCASDLAVGTLPDAALDAKSRCGTLTGSNGSAAVVEATADGQPLTNGVGYAFSVASIDQFGNVGPLSAPVCEVPAADGPAGSASDEGEEGSSCAASPARAGGLGGASLLALALALVLGLARRQRGRRG